MNYSFRSMLKRGKSRLLIMWKVIRRAALLFAFGIILNTNWGRMYLHNKSHKRRIDVTWLPKTNKTAFKDDLNQDQVDIIVYCFISQNDIPNLEITNEIHTKAVT